MVNSHGFAFFFHYSMAMPERVSPPPSLTPTDSESDNDEEPRRIPSTPPDKMGLSPKKPKRSKRAKSRFDWWYLQVPASASMTAPDEKEKKKQEVESIESESERGPKRKIAVASIPQTHCPEGETILAFKRNGFK